MVDGYTVKEAASVLGVPKERVWELLARGILAGTPEDGGGMRVYLQGRPMEPIVGRPPEGPPAGSDERRGPNGSGGEHGQPGFEASPFRELLTEFRSLTERYGQALLALGESRGEVASLRTRVELLEARVDLRLPPAPPLVQWSPPAQAQAAPQAETGPEPMPPLADDEARAMESTSLPEPEPEPEPEPGPELDPVSAEVPAEDEPMAKTTRARRRRKGRSATAGFAEALARAQDPTLSDLPGGEEAQAALNELRDRIRRESSRADSEESLAGADEPAEAMTFGDGTALAPEVELDPFLADEELGGEAEAATVTEVVEEAVPTPTGQVQDIDEPEAVQVADVAPVEVVEAVTPADVGAPVDAVEPFAPVAEGSDAPAQAPAYSHEWDEPDWIAEEDVDWGGGEPPTSPLPVAMGESPEIGWDELPAATAPAHPEPASGSASASASGSAAQQQSDDRADEPFASESTPVRVEHEEPDPPSGAEPPTSEPIRVEAIAPVSRSSSGPPGGDSRGDASATSSQGENSASSQAAEEEDMWLGDEFRAGPPSWGSSGRSTTIPKRATRPAIPDVGVSRAEDEALSRMAVERGWDDQELSAIRSLLAQPGRVAFDEADLGATASAQSTQAPAEARPSPEPAEPAQQSHAEQPGEEEAAFDWEQGPSAWSPPPTARPSRELPGALELDQAMAAFEVGAWSKESTVRRDEHTAEPAGHPSGDEAQGHAGAPLPPTNAEPAPNAAPPSSSAPSEPSTAGETDWLRGRRGPAANAYRRLRRLFP